MAIRKETKGFFLGALAGGVIGSIAALLFAPKAGKELRQDIAAGAQKVGDTTIKAAGKVGETTGRIAKEIGGQATHIASLGKQAAGNVVSGVKGFRKNTDTSAVVMISGTITEGPASADPAEQGLEEGVKAEA
jgi:gas vesicle protein